MITEYNKIYNMDCIEGLKTLADESINCCVTSPPYWGLRDYGHDEQLGLENTPEEYIASMVAVFAEVRRVLKKDGTLWLNLGDSYSGSGKGQTADGCADPKNQKTMGMKLNNKLKTGLKPKDLIGIPWAVAFALRADGWYLRQDIIWAKPNPMPESVTDRCTKAHEYIFLLSKSQHYYFDNEAIKEKSVCDDKMMIDGFVPKSENGKHKGDNQATNNRKKYNSTQAGGGTSMKNHNGYYKEDGSPIGVPGFRNKRSVWSVTTSPFKEAHFATFPEDLIEPMILAGCPKRGIVLDPFMGAGTTAVVAKKNNRQYVGFELNQKYIDIAKKRIINNGEYFDF